MEWSLRLGKLRSVETFPQLEISRRLKPVPVVTLRGLFISALATSVELFLHSDATLWSSNLYNLLKVKKHFCLHI